MDASSRTACLNPPAPEIHIIADDLVHPDGENPEPVMAGQMQPVRVPQMIEAAQVVAGNGYYLNVGFAEDGHGARHVAGAGDEQKSLQVALLHQRRDLERLIMRVTTKSEAMPLDFKRGVILEVVTNRIRLREHPALMRIATASED